MKLKVFLFSLFALSIFIISCNKYEEGPMISLKSAEKRIAGDYTVDKYLINGVEINLTDQGITEYRVVYNSDGTGKTYITVNDSPLETDFEWELDEKNENIRERSLGLNDEWSAWSDYKQILRLTNDEFWITDGDTEESTEFHFIEQ
jgi:hypothetical protein